jgi:hypothetical protein
MTEVHFDLEYFIGLTSMNGLREISFKEVEALPKEIGIDGYTVSSPGRGYYRGTDESSVVIRILKTISTSEMTPKDVVVYIDKLNSLAQQLRTRLGQREILVKVAVEIGGEVYSWKRSVTGYDEVPFLFPGHFVSLLWRDGKGFNENALFRHLTAKYDPPHGCTEALVFREDIPLLLLPQRGASLRIDLAADGFHQQRQLFDNNIVRLASDTPAFTTTDKDQAPGDYVSMFRRASQSPVFSATNLDAVVTSPLDNPLTVHQIPYRYGLGLCESHYMAQLAHWCLTKNATPALPQDWSYRSMITVLTLFRTPEFDKVLVKKRSGSVGIYPHRITAAPWGHLEPLLDEVPSVIDSMLQEIDEELLSGREMESKRQSLYRRLGDICGFVTHLGTAFDLVRPCVHIMLNFVVDAKWWFKNEHRIRMNWEYQDDNYYLDDIDAIAQNYEGKYIPATVLAANLSRELESSKNPPA